MLAIFRGATPRNTFPVMSLVLDIVGWFFLLEKNLTRATPHRTAWAQYKRKKEAEEETDCLISDAMRTFVSTSRFYIIACIYNRLFNIDQRRRVHRRSERQRRRVHRRSEPQDRIQRAVSCHRADVPRAGMITKKKHTDERLVTLVVHVKMTLVSWTGRVGSGGGGGGGGGGGAGGGVRVGGGGGEGMNSAALRTYVSTSRTLSF